jgi:hypothetical protein
MEIPSMTMSKIALVAALVLGAGSGVAYAGGKDDPDTAGGFRVGPLGQVMTSGVNPVDHRSLRGRTAYGAAFARAPRHQQ